MLEKHLMNDPTDPFTRQKLSLDMIKPCTELKAKIDSYKKKKHKK